MNLDEARRVLHTRIANVDSPRSRRGEGLTSSEIAAIVASLTTAAFVVAPDPNSVTQFEQYLAIPLRDES